MLLSPGAGPEVTFKMDEIPQTARWRSHWFPTCWFNSMISASLPPFLDNDGFFLNAGVLCWTRCGVGMFLGTVGDVLCGPVAVRDRKRFILKEEIAKENKKNDQSFAMNEKVFSVEAMDVAHYRELMLFIWSYRNCKFCSTDSQQPISFAIKKKVQTSISASAHTSIIYNTYHHCLINAVRPTTTQQALTRPIGSLRLLKQEALAETGPGCRSGRCYSG